MLHRSRLASMSAAAALLLTVGCGGSELDLPGGQPAPEPPPTGEPAISVFPMSGTTATDVTITGSGFTPNSTVRIGFGPPQSEYDILASTTADSDGRIRTTVNVPNWAQNGRDYLFVGVPLTGDEAISGRFTVTTGGDGDDDGDVVRITGTLTEEGVECPALRADNGRLYTLAGDTGRFGSGDRVTVEGSVAGASICMQGTTIDVDDISDTR